jgi:hypothetical protein
VLFDGCRIAALPDEKSPLPVLNLPPSRNEFPVHGGLVPGWSLLYPPGVRLLGVVQLIAGMVGEQDAVEVEVVAATVEDHTAAAVCLVSV